jgi:hypothetical protein
MTSRLAIAVTRSDRDGRLPLGRLGLYPPFDNEGVLHPARWAAGVLVLAASPAPLPPAQRDLVGVATLDDRERLKVGRLMQTHLDAVGEPLLAASDGTQLWLLTTAFLRRHLP